MWTGSLCRSRNSNGGHRRVPLNVILTVLLLVLRTSSCYCTIEISDCSIWSDVVIVFALA